MLSGIKAFSLVVYTAWKVWILKDRWEKTGSTYNQKLLFCSEVLYTLVMLHLLLTLNANFIYIALINLLLHVSFGMYVELFRPEIKLNSNARHALVNYWQFVLLDSVITFTSFAISVGG